MGTTVKLTENFHELACKIQASTSSLRVQMHRYVPYLFFTLFPVGILFTHIIIFFGVHELRFPQRGKKLNNKAFINS